MHSCRFSVINHVVISQPDEQVYQNIPAICFFCTYTEAEEIDDVNAALVDEYEDSCLKQPLHVPVLAHKVVELLNPRPGQVQSPLTNTDIVTCIIG